MERWNRADSVLSAAAALFFVLLFLKLQLGYHFWLECAFFCTEAALVGGIADWFAVTALFKKPLGFPYHTALIPRRREQLIESCIHMVQREFFSRRRLIGRLKEEALLPKLILWLETMEGRSLLQSVLSEAVTDVIQSFDTEKKAAAIERLVRAKLSAYPAGEALTRLTTWLERHNYDAVLLDKVLVELGELAAAESTRAKIVSLIEDYVAEQSKNPLAALMFMFAKSTDLLNYEEAATAIQGELIKTVASLSEEGSQLRCCVLEELRASLAYLKDSEPVQRCIHELRQEALSSLQLARPLQLFFDHLTHTYGGADGSVPAAVSDFIDERLNALLESLRTDETLRAKTESYIYDLAGHAILQAQAMLGVVVRTAMKGLSDKQLNELLYSKVETDLVWIRMNGSIVGASIGFVLFMAKNLWR